MAKIANTVTTFDVKGLREQLADVIYNIDPTDTVFVSNAARGSVKGTFAEWQQDSLAAPNTANVAPQGDDITSFDAVVPTVRLGNYTQISRKTAIISGTEEIVEKAGRDSELGYQMAKKGKELRIDIESMLLSNIAAASGSTSVAAVTASLLAFIKTNTSLGATGANPTYTTVPNAVRTDGTARALTETLLKGVIAQCWSAGASPKVVLVGAGNKQVVSGFGGIATKFTQTGGKMQATIIGAADVYVSDFGVLSIVPSRFQRNRDAFVLDFSLISVDYLRPFKQVPLATTGDAEKRMLLAEYMLRVKAEKGLGAVYDLL